MWKPREDHFFLSQSLHERNNVRHIFIDVTFWICFLIWFLAVIKKKKTKKPDHKIVSITTGLKWVLRANNVNVNCHIFNRAHNFPRITNEEVVFTRIAFHTSLCFNTLNFILTLSNPFKKKTPQGGTLYNYLPSEAYPVASGNGAGKVSSLHGSQVCH